MNRQQLYRSLPKVDSFLESPAGRGMAAQYGRRETTEAVRTVLDYIRKRIAESTEGAKNSESTEGRKTAAGVSGSLEELIVSLEHLVEAELRKKNERHFKRVINATGIILHTNLGRAPAAAAAADGLAAMLKGYTNLEYDLETGSRGERYTHFEQLICRLTGAEAAMAVNNNAAAVMLMLNTFARGKEVILSRGEMIEIGGKFRIPEVMEASGCRLKEIGTTNKTHFSDYEEAVCTETGAILKVHTSNYRVIGFTDSVASGELVPLKKAHGLPLLEDLGSGVLVPLERFGLAHEPTVQESIAAGVDVVCFSGDKLLGGPQAGILAGKKEYIDRIKKNPLTRALRIDKCTAYLLEETLHSYLKESCCSEIPVYRYLSRSSEMLETMARSLCGFLQREMNCNGEDGVCVPEHADNPRALMTWEIRNDSAPMGGGSLPLEQIESRQAALHLKKKAGLCASELAQRLHFAFVPVITRIVDDRVCLDMRCMEEEDLQTAAREIAECVRDAASGRERRAAGVKQIGKERQAGI